MIVVESFGIIPLFNDDGTWKVLLILHRVGNHWGFPKGKAQSAETALEAATRELKEETGLVVTRVLLEQPIKEQYQFRRGKQAIVKIVHYFPALVEGIVHLQEEEIRDARWLTISDAMKQLTFGEARHILDECVRHLTILPS